MTKVPFLLVRNFEAAASRGFYSNKKETYVPRARWGVRKSCTAYFPRSTSMASSSGSGPCSSSTGVKAGGSTLAKKVALASSMRDRMLSGLGSSPGKLVGTLYNRDRLPSGFVCNNINGLQSHIEAIYSDREEMRQIKKVVG